MELRRIAAENQRIVDAGRYRTDEGVQVEIGSLLDAAVKGTREYGPSELTGPPTFDTRRDTHRNTPQEPTAEINDSGKTSNGQDATSDGPVSSSGTRIEVTGEDTILAVRRLVGLAEGGRVAALNFASARHPGGGYLTGAKAQEEDICRKTLLYPCLLAVSDYYAAHQRARDPFYSDRLIYSPEVPVIRDQHNRLTAPVVTVDVITCAAPNAGVLRRYRPESVGRIPQQLTQRAGVVLAAAARHGARRLVLGAWGCGVFGNDPRQVAAAFRTHLCDQGGYRDVFAQVTFAVLDRTQSQLNLQAFREAFAG